MKPTPATQGELIPTKVKRPGKDTYNIDSIKARKYHTLDMGEYYNQLMGAPENKFVAMFYGLPAGGKSVFTLLFAEFLANHYGKTFYNSHEEGIKKTIQDRINNFEIESKKLWFGDTVSFERMMHKIQNKHYRFVIIDSVQYMNFTFEQLQEMRHHFKKRHMSIIMVSFGSKWGACDRGATELLYASDIKGFFYMEDNTGFAKFHSRYTGKSVTTELFKMNEEIVVAPKDKSKVILVTPETISL